MEISVEGKYAASAGLGALFAALADPTRRQLLEDLRDGDQTVNNLAARYSVGVPAISKHLTVLEKAGLISRRKTAQWRHCHLEPAGFDRLARWSRHYQQLWEGSLEGLDAYLANQQQDKA